MTNNNQTSRMFTMQLEDGIKVVVHIKVIYPDDNPPSRDAFGRWVPSDSDGER